MDAQDQHPPMQGDDELAKALQGGLQFEETPVPGGQASVAPDPAAVAQPNQAAAPTDEPPTLGTALPQPEDALPDEDDTQTPSPEPTPTPAIKHHGKNSNATPSPATNATTGSGELEKLKASALEELRPLVGKLDLPAEEKFDTLLLIIRSTDDQSLLDEAHDAAKNISDDGKRAQALLDVIKEIDYFSSKR